MLATYLFRHAPTSWENPVLRWLHGRYERALRWTIAYPKSVLAGAAAVVAAALVMSAFLGTEFLPQLDEGVVWIRANFPAGISLAKSADLASEIRRLVKQSPEVREVASQTGRNDDGTDPYGPNRNELFVALTPYDTWPRGKVKATLVEELSQRLKAPFPAGSSASRSRSSTTSPRR